MICDSALCESFRIRKSWIEPKKETVFQKIEDKAGIGGPMVNWRVFGNNMEVEEERFDVMKWF